MENKIKVSVIMPVYNSGEYLKTAVDSILSQSLKEIELILVDDGSTDGSSERCDEYAAKDSRVVVIHQKNGGICNARNAALKMPRGNILDSQITMMSLCKVFWNMLIVRQWNMMQTL